jgi:hypothetical protein
VLERPAGGSARALLLIAEERPRERDRERAGLACFVLRGHGLRARLELCLPDAARARAAGPVEWRGFFRRVDVTRDAELLAGDAPADLARLAPLLSDPRAPDVEPSPHCFRPVRCPYREACERPFPLDWIGHLPRLRPERAYELRERGIRRIRELPDDVALGPEQRAARRAARGAGTWVSAELPALLAGFGPPAAFLDFEAIAPVVPLLAGMRPFEVLPVQWSLRALDRSGRVGLAAFLAELPGDPRPALADALLEAAGPSELPLVVYSAFESEVLADLARALPERADGLMRLRASLRDLQPVVRAHAYRLEQRGAYALKRVLPAFAPGFGWSDLAIRSGGAAADTWLALARGELAADAVDRALRDLAAYCARDTEALEVLLSALRALRA